MGSCYVVHAGPELAAILLPQSPECQDRDMSYQGRQEDWVYELSKEPGETGPCELEEIIHSSGTKVVASQITLHPKLENSTLFGGHPV